MARHQAAQHQATRVARWGRPAACGREAALPGLLHFLRPDWLDTQSHNRAHSMFQCARRLAPHRRAVLVSAHMAQHTHAAVRLHCGVAHATRHAVRLQDIISKLDDSSGAGRLADLSVHLCFICLLHLANEHGLAIADGPDLRTLTISGFPTR